MIAPVLVSLRRSRSSLMVRAETILPPQVILSPGVIYAIQGDIYALEPSNGAVRHHYPIDGLAVPAVTHEIIYLNVTNQFSNTVQAIGASNGISLWHYPVDDRLAGAPAIGDGALYVCTYDGSVLALGIN